MSTVPAETFGAQFLAEFTEIDRESIEQDHGVRRRRAIRVLPGVPWRMIPTERCGRVSIVGLKGLFLLCCCLDVVNEDEGLVAIPGQVTTEALYWAWRAAGYETWLKREVLRELRNRADRDVLRDNPELLMASIAARMGATS